MDKNDFKNEVKSFLRIAPHVDVYDNDIEMLIDSAIATLKVAGVELVKSSLVVDFITCYVRVRMLQDASDSFRNSELERENMLIRQLSYGIE